MIELFFKARRFVVKMRQLDINAYSASAAFFLFISLVPILVLICSMFPYTGLSEEELIKLIEAATPIIRYMTPMPELLPYRSLRRYGLQERV